MTGDASNDVEALVGALRDPLKGGVSLSGPNASGLAIALLGRLRTGREVVATAPNPEVPHDVLAAVASAFVEAATVAGYPEAHPWRSLAGPLSDPRHHWEDRFDLLAVHLLPNYPVLLLVESPGADADLEKLLVAWVGRPSAGKVLVAGPHPFGPTDHHWLVYQA